MVPRTPHHWLKVAVLGLILGVAWPLPALAQAHSEAPYVGAGIASPSPAASAPATESPSLAPDADPALIELETQGLIRHHQLTIHQALGLSTLVAMGTTFAVGKLYASGLLPQAVHVGAAGFTTGLYLTTASMALLAPPPPLTSDQNVGWDSVGVHRAMAWLHGAGMASTMGLGLSSVLGGPSNPSLHGWLGLGSSILLGLSAGGILLAP